MNYSPFHSIEACLEVLHQTKCYVLTPAPSASTFDSQMFALLEEAIFTLEAIVDSDQANSDPLKVAISKMSVTMLDPDDEFVSRRELESILETLFKDIKEIICPSQP
jgi:hypothetical protein